MIDFFVMFGFLVVACGGFVALYAIYMFVLAKLSGISFLEALKWWDD